jgi:hypothetical protein
MPPTRWPPLPDALQIAPRDDVAVALRPLEAGQTVRVGTASITLNQAIPAGHKFALVPIAAGAPVHRYGARIGLATVAIAVGDHVHSHNMATALRGEVDYAFAPQAAPPCRWAAPTRRRSWATSAPMAAWAPATKCGSCPRWGASGGWANGWRSAARP